MSSFSPSSSLKRRLPPPSSTNDDDAQDSRRPSKTTKLHNNASSSSSPSSSSSSSSATATATATAATTPQHQQIYRSAPLTDRASTFTAAFSPTLPARALQAHPDFVSATHRIAAWRRPTAQRKLFAPSAPSSSPSPSLSSSSSSNGSLAVGRVTETGFDDDGEQHAGKRLANVLEAMGVGEGAVVVARWYGGVMLGPVRFAHVEKVAREAVGAWMRGRRVGVAAAGVAEENAAGDRERLVRVLEERDGSLAVLRRLLAEKKGVVAGEREGGVVGMAETGTKKMDYGKLPVQALVRLEKARDASIAFVLKELDRVEDEILEGMGDGGEEELGEEGDEAEAEITGPSQRDGEDGKAVGGDVAEERLGADHGEKVAEKQKQAESAVDDESPAERPES